MKKFSKIVLGLMIFICVGLFAPMFLGGCGNNTDNGPIDIDSLIVKESVGGTYERLSKDSNGNSDGEYIIKPVAENGYYFDHWQISYRGRIEYEYVQYEPYLNCSNYTANYKIEPVFTTNEPQFADIQITVNVENDIDVEYEYMLYKDHYYNNNGGTDINIYFYENDNVVLSYIGEVFPDEYYAGNVVREDIKRTMPYLRGRLGYNPDFGQAEEIIFKFTDISNKCLIYIDQEGMSGEEDYIVCDLGETIIVNTDYISSYGCFDCWKDEEGNILSTEEEFEYTVIGNATIKLYTKEYDVMYTDDDGHQYSFMKEENGTLTLYRFSYKQKDTIRIPESVKGVPVTGIGLLLVDGFGGTLIIPDSVKNIHHNAFRYMSKGSGYGATIKFESDRTDLYASTFYNCNNKLLFDFSENTLTAMVNNELHKLVTEDISLNVIFSEEMPENTLGYYTEGTYDITIEKLSEGKLWNRNILNVIVHELRHFYQQIAIGDFEEIDLDKCFVVKPTQNQIGAWKFLPYTSSSENYDQYYYNAREIDSREYAGLVVGFDVV